MFKCSVRCDKMCFRYILHCDMLGLSTVCSVNDVFKYTVQCDMLALSAVTTVNKICLSTVSAVKRYV